MVFSHLFNIYLQENKSQPNSSFKCSWVFGKLLCSYWKTCHFVCNDEMDNIYKKMSKVMSEAKMSTNNNNNVMSQLI